MRAIGLAIAASLTLSAPLAAQPAPQGAPAWSGSIGLGFSWHGGPSSFTSLLSDASLQHRRGAWEVVADAKGTYSRNRTEGLDAEGTPRGWTTTSHSWEVETRVRPVDSQRLHWHYWGEWQRSRNLALDHRVMVMGGIGLEVGAASSARLRLSPSAGFLYERHSNVATGPLQLPAAGLSTDASVPLGSGGAALTLDGELVQNLDDLQDILADIEIALQAPMTSRLALNVMYKHTWDNRPSLGFLDHSKDEEVLTTTPPRGLGVLTFNVRLRL